MESSTSTGNSSLFSTIPEAWKKVYGVKTEFFLATLVLLAITFIGFFALEIVAYILTELKLNPTLTSVLNLIIEFIGTMIFCITSLSYAYLGLRRASNEPISISLMLKVLNMELIFKAAILACIPYLIGFGIGFGLGFSLAIFSPTSMESNTAFNILFVGIIIACILAVYISMRFYLCLMILVDREFTLKQALQLSWKLTRKNVLSIMLLSIINFLAIILGILTLGIGLLWAFPYAAINYGLVYRKLIGLDDSSKRAMLVENPNASTPGR